MKDLKLNKVVKLEEKDLKKVKGGDKVPCGCGCSDLNGLHNSFESLNAVKFRH